MYQDDEALLSPAETQKLAGGLSQSTIHRKVSKGEFPAPVILARDKLGRPSRVAWVYGEVREWCRAQIAGRDEAA